MRLPAGPLRLGRGAGRELDRVARGPAASTSSATSPSCVPCARPGRRGRAARPGPQQAQVQRRRRRPGRDDAEAARRPDPDKTGLGRVRTGVRAGPVAAVTQDPTTDAGDAGRRARAGLGRAPARRRYDAVGRLVDGGRAGRPPSSRRPAARAAPPAQPAPHPPAYPPISPRGCSMRARPAGAHRPPARRRRPAVRLRPRRRSTRRAARRRAGPRGHQRDRRRRGRRRRPRARRATAARPWRRPYRLVGTPRWPTRSRAQLVARGRPPGGRGARILVVGRGRRHDAGRRLRGARPRHRGPAWARWLDILPRATELAAARRPGRGRPRTGPSGPRPSGSRRARRPTQVPRSPAYAGGCPRRRALPAPGGRPGPAGGGGARPPRRARPPRGAAARDAGPAAARLPGPPRRSPTQHRDWVEERAGQDAPTGCAARATLSWHPRRAAAGVPGRRGGPCRPRRRAGRGRASCSAGRGLGETLPEATRRAATGGREDDA